MLMQKTVWLFLQLNALNMDLSFLDRDVNTGFSVSSQSCHSHITRRLMTFWCSDRNALDFNIVQVTFHENCRL